MADLARRQVVLASTALLCGFGARAQDRKVWRIGVLSPRSRPDPVESDTNFRSLVEGLRELGYVEGRNLRLDWRFADGRMERLPAFAEELARFKVDAIVAAGNQAIAAAQKSTATIPIVIATSIDPVGSGFVKTLAHPGGNITGLSNLTGEISAKHLELLVGAVPGLSRVAVLIDPSNAAHATIVKSVQNAAAATHVQILVLEARSPSEIESAFAAMSRQKAGGVIVAVDGLFTRQAGQIAQLAGKERMASIYTSAALAEAGGLFGYGQDFADNYRRAAAYLDKIFKGARPADLPVEQSTKFVLTVNLKTAKTLGISVPASIMLRADKVIQ